MKITDVYGKEYSLEITATHTCIAVNSVVQTYINALNEIDKLINKLFDKPGKYVRAKTKYENVMLVLNDQLDNCPNLDNYTVDVVPGELYSAEQVNELMSKAVRRINRQNRQYEKMHEEHRALNVRFSNHCHDVDSKNASLNNLLIKYNKPKPPHLNMTGHLTYLLHDLLGVKPARPAPGSVYINGHNVNKYYANGCGDNSLVVLCDDIKAPAPSLAPQLPMVPPAPAPRPMEVVMQPSSKLFSYHDYIKQGWTDQQLVEVGYAKWLSEPNQSHLMYPPIIGESRKKLSSVTINNKQWFCDVDMLDLLHAWEQFHTNEFNTVKQLIKYDRDDGVGFIDYLQDWCDYHNRVVSHVDYVFKDLDLTIKGVSTIDKLTLIDNTIEVALVNNTKVSNVINKIHDKIGLPAISNTVDVFDKLKAIDFHIDKLESTVTSNMTNPQGVFIHGDLCVMDSLSDQWSQIYELVHKSAGGTVDNATYAAQSFIDSIK